MSTFIKYQMDALLFSTCVWQHRGSSSPGDLLGLIKAAATLSRNSPKYTADDGPSYKAGSTVLDSGPWCSCSLPG